MRRSRADARQDEKGEKHRKAPASGDKSSSLFCPNELIINGSVYDERKAVFEFEHNLKATVGGHVIEAGLDSNNFSYILFDDELIAEEERFI